jgi:hypothetical protein
MRAESTLDKAFPKIANTAMRRNMPAEGVLFQGRAIRRGAEP